MASAIIPAGGAGTASYADKENIQTREYKRIWSDKSTRDIVFDIITYITQMVKEDISPDELRFYAKGGNAIALLLERDTIPSIFPSDFDFSIDINPALSVKEYNKKQLLFIELVINYMIQKIKETCSSSRTRQKKPCIEIQSYNEARIPPVNVELENYIDTLPSDTKKQCSVDCPYRIFIRKNMLFIDIAQNRGIITLQKSFEGRFIDLLDVSFILRTTVSDAVSTKIEEEILYQWNNLGFVVYDFPHTPTNHRLFINVYDPLSAYINMRIAAQTKPRHRRCP